jgi:hypothetical protein
MASSDFFVHTPGLDQNAGEYVQVAQTVSRLGQQVNSDASGYNGVWGNDDAGEKFAPGYLTNMTNFVEGVTALADVLQATSDGLILMSKNFVKAEDHNTEVARKLAVDFKPSEGGGESGGGGEGGPPPAKRMLAMKREQGQLLPRKLAVQNEPGVFPAQKQMGLKFTGIVEENLPGGIDAQVQEGQPLLPRQLAVENQSGEFPARKQLGLKYSPGELQPMESGKLITRDASVPTLPGEPGLPVDVGQPPIFLKSEGPIEPEQLGSWASNQREWNSALLNTDQELRTEYARRGLEYPEPFGPPVQATPALRLAVDDGPPTQVELAQTAQVLRDADVRLQGVQERVLAAGEAIGWEFAAATPTISGVPLREDG